MSGLFRDPALIARLHARTHQSWRGGLMPSCDLYRNKGGRILAGTPYTYHFVVIDSRGGLTVVHGGITTNPARREREHREKWPNGSLRIVGGPMSESAARAWERKEGYA